MTVPTLEKTWTISHATYAGNANAATQYRQIMYDFKAFLVLPAISGGGGFTVTLSTDGTHGPDGTDWWGTTAGLVWNYNDNAGYNHSWIVLRSAHAKPWYFLIDLASGDLSPPHAKFWVADEPFTGGTLYSPPTSPTMQALHGAFPADWWTGGYADANRQYQYHRMVSGNDVRYLACTSGEAAFYFFCEGYADSRGSDNPNCIGFCGMTSPCLTYALFHDIATYCFVTADTISESNVCGKAYMTSEGIGASTTGALGRQQVIADAGDGLFPVMPIGLYSPTANHVGRRGRLQDLYWSCTINASGTTAPANATKTWIQMGSFWFPGDGTDWARS